MEGLLHERIINGREAARRVRAEVASEVARLGAQGVVPQVAFVRVGDDPASAIYVNAKARACAEVGVRSSHLHLAASSSEAEVRRTLEALAADEDVDGILLQLPLPSGIPDLQLLNAIPPEKDVDGFHTLNLGAVVAGRGPLEPCTPAGIMRLIGMLGVEVRGKEAVVIGRSVVVGRMMASMLLRADATIAVCHRHTAALREHVARAEVLVVAAGVPGLVPGAWVREGAWVFDVGSTRMPDGRISGDVEFAAARERVAGITPVPGGIGPMTIAQLLVNTVTAAQLRRGLVPFVIKRA